MASVIRRPAPSFKPGDLVRTPTGRTAIVEELRDDGRRDLRFVDLEGGYVALLPERLTLVRSAPVRPWKVRVLS